MRLIAALALFALAIPQAKADLFPSIDAFLEAARGYDFARDPWKLGFHLSIEEPRQPEQHARIATPAKVDSVNLLWSSADSALIFLTARPATDSTRTETALLLALGRHDGGWFISSKHPFRATGKDAHIRCQLTGAGHTPPPIVTVTSTNGGRGASYRASATYELTAGQLNRKDP
jgi:hypothetical protein